MIGPAAAFRTILEPYERREPIEPDDEAQSLRELVRDIAATPLCATISGEPNQYHIRLTSVAPLPDLPTAGVGATARITAQLYTRPGEAAQLTAGQPIDAHFGELALEDITPFVIITAEDGNGARERTVVLAQLANEPPGRLDRIMARQIDSPEKFLRFLMLLLGLGADPTALGAVTADGNGKWLGGTGTGILELLLNALVDRPQQLDELARIIARFQSDGRSQDLLPPGFEQLWQVVDEVRRAEARAEARKETA